MNSLAASLDVLDSLAHFIGEGHDGRIFRLEARQRK